MASSPKHRKSRALEGDMEATYPVYRAGMLLESTARVVSEDTADVIAEAIRSEYDQYLSSLAEALRDSGAKQIRTVRHETVLARRGRKRVYDLPAIFFEHGGYWIKSRPAVTVCVGTRKSKIWIRFTCKKLNGRTAVKMSSPDVRAYFEHIEHLVDPCLRAIFRVYEQHLRTRDVSLAEFRDYYRFSFRAFNSRRPEVENLHEALLAGLPLSEALEDPEYETAVLEFFKVVFGSKETQVTPSSIIESLEDGRVDIFGYATRDHKALYAARITENSADLCGFGHDRRLTPGPDLLAQRTTSALVNDYGSAF